MTAPQGMLRAHQGEQCVLFRVEGRAQMDLGMALRRCGEQGLARGATSMLVDLRQCAYMDSTFLGTLLFLKRAAERRPCGRFALVAPSLDCCQLLEQMGLADVFPIATGEELAVVDCTALDAGMDDVKAFQLNVVQAHVELANLPGRAAEPFKKVARMLTQEMEAKNATPTAEAVGCEPPASSQ
jgi:anti-anti-sigma factor